MIFKTKENNTAISVESNESFELSVDVVVVGLGTAGSFALLSAARKGLKVIGIEKTDRMGGVATSACVYDYYYGASFKYADKINEDSTKLNFISTQNNSDQPSINGNAKAIILEEEATKHDAKLFFNSKVMGVFLEQNTVIGIKLFYFSKTINIKCKIIIDCSDGFVCELCGVKMRCGRKSDGHTMKFSTTIGCLENNLLRGNWVTKYYSDFKDNKDKTDKIISSLVLPPCYPENCNSKEYKPIITFGTIIGNRECSYITSEIEYGFTDFLDDKKVDHPVMYAMSPVDNTNKDLLNESRCIQDYQLICSMNFYGITPAVPYESLIPKGVDGIIVAGKSIGLNRGLHASIRMKYDIERMGYAAGLIADISIRNNCNPRINDYFKVKQVLEKEGILDDNQNLGLFSLTELNSKKYKKVTLPETDNELIDLLNSTSPELALYAIRKKSKGREKDRLIELLQKNINSNSTLLRENSIIALGLIDKTIVLKELETLASTERKVFFHENENPAFDWYKYTYHCNKDKATCLISR